MPRRLALTALAVCSIAGACSAGTPATPSPAPTAGPTAAPTATPTQPPTTAPTTTPTAAPTAQATPDANAAVALLISYAHPDLQDTCEVRSQLYDSEIASISCGPEDLPFDFSLFGSFASLAAAYTDDVGGAETPPQPDGACVEGNYEGSYTVGDQPAGRVNCREHTSTSTGAMYHVLEWTNDDLLVIGYISNRVDLHTWDELITFWKDQAGPFAP